MTHMCLEFWSYVCNMFVKCWFVTNCTLPGGNIGNCVAANEAHKIDWCGWNRDWTVNRNNAGIDACVCVKKINNMMHSAFFGVGGNVLCSHCCQTKCWKWPEIYKQDTRLEHIVCRFGTGKGSKHLHIIYTRFEIIVGTRIVVLGFVVGPVSSMFNSRFQIWNMKMSSVPFVQCRTGISNAQWTFNLAFRRGCNVGTNEGESNVRYANDMMIWASTL